MCENKCVYLFSEFWEQESDYIFLFADNAFFVFSRNYHFISQNTFETYLPDYVS